MHRTDIQQIQDQGPHYLWEWRSWILALPVCNATLDFSLNKKKYGNI